MQGVTFRVSYRNWVLGSGQSGGWGVGEGAMKYYCYISLGHEISQLVILILPSVLVERVCEDVPGWILEDRNK